MYEGVVFLEYCMKLYGDSHETSLDNGACRIVCRESYSKQVFSWLSNTELVSTITNKFSRNIGCNIGRYDTRIGLIRKSSIGQIWQMESILEIPMVLHEGRHTAWQQLAGRASNEYQTKHCIGNKNSMYSSKTRSLKMPYKTIF